MPKKNLEFSNHFNNKDWKSVLQTIQAEELHLKHKFDYSEPSYAGGWIGGNIIKGRTIIDLLLSSTDIPKDAMVAALVSDSLPNDKNNQITYEELLTYLVNAQSVGARQAIAESLAQHPKAALNSKITINANMPMADEYVAIHDAGTETNLLYYFVTSREVDAKTLQTLLSKASTHDKDILINAMMLCDDKSKMSVIATCLMQTDYVVDKDLIKKLVDEGFTEALQILQKKKVASKTTDINQMEVPELLNNLVVQENIGVQKKIAEKVAEKRSNDQSPVENAGVIGWLRAGVKDNEIVERLVRARVISLSIAINSGWSNYEQVNNLIQYDSSLLYNGEVTLKHYTTYQDAESITFSDKKTNILEFFATDANINSTTLLAILNRGDVKITDLMSVINVCVGVEKKAVLMKKLISLKDLDDGAKALIFEYVGGLEDGALNDVLKDMAPELRREVVNTITTIELYKKGASTSLTVLVKDEEIDFSAVDSNQNNLLHYAIANNDYKFAIELIKSGKVNLHQKNNKGITPLSLLCSLNGTAEAIGVARELLKDKAFMSKANGEPIDMLNLILMSSKVNLDLAKALINERSGDKEFINTLFNDACKNGSVALVKELLNQPIKEPNNISYNIKGAKATSNTLVYAIENNNLELFTALLDSKKINVDITYNGQSLFAYLLSKNKEEYLVALVEKRADDIKPEKLLLEAVQKILKKAETEAVNTAALNAILKFDKISDGKETNSGLVFYKGILALEEKLKEMILQKKEQKDIDRLQENIKQLKSVMLNEKFISAKKDEHGVGLLMLAAANGDKELAAQLAAKADRKDLITGDKKHNKIPLINLIKMGNQEVVGKVTEEDLKIKDGNGIDSVMAAAISQDAAVFEIVASKVGENYKFNLRDKLGNSSLHHAIGNKEIVAKLLEKKVDVDIKNKDGLTPFAKAVIKGDLDSIKALIAAGADVNIADKKGMTPLMHAILHNNREIINEILKQPNLHIHAVNEYGMNAFMFAALCGDRNKEDITSQEMVWSNGNEDIMKALIERGASPIFGDVYGSLAANFLENIAWGYGIAATTDYIANSLESASSVAPPGIVATAMSVGSKIFAMGRTVGAAGLAAANYKQVEQQLTVNLQDAFDMGVKVDVSNTMMVGSFAYRSFLGFKWVTKGDSLRDKMNEHKVYQDKLNDKAFNVESYAPESPQQAAKDHEQLMARYFAINAEIKKYKFPFSFVRSSLEALREEVLKADKKAMQVIYGDNNFNYDKFVNLIKHDAIARKIMNQDTEVKDSIEIIRRIKTQEIIVPIEVMEVIEKLESKIKDIKKHPKSHEASLFKGDIDAGINVDEIKAVMNGALQGGYKRSEPIQHVEDKARFKGNFLTQGIYNLTGVDQQKVANAVIYGVAKAGAAISAMATYAVIDRGNSEKALQLAAHSIVAAGGASVILTPIISAATAVLVPVITVAAAGAAAIAAANVAGKAVSDYQTQATEEVKAPITEVNTTSLQEHPIGEVAEFISGTATDLKVLTNEERLEERGKEGAMSRLVSVISSGLNDAVTAMATTSIQTKPVDTTPLVVDSGALVDMAGLLSKTEEKDKEQQQRK